MLEKVPLGSTGMQVTRVSFGCLPLQRITKEEAVTLLRRAYDAGVNFYDTAHVYTDSQSKIAAAFDSGMRKNIYIASKTMSTTYEQAMAQIDNSLTQLGTDYIDLYQWHNPASIDHLDDPASPYMALVDAKRQGKILHIGLTNHNYDRARAAIASGAFETLQYPFSMLSSAREIDLAQEAADHGMGFIAMKGMCGGLLEDGRVPFAFMHQYPHVVPIWGMQRVSELEQFLQLAENPPAFDDDMRAQIKAIQAELGDSFCRGCGYCLPCPAQIQLPIAMRMSCFLKRNALDKYLDEEHYAQMQRIEDCQHCNACAKRCPYHLDPPTRLAEEWTLYQRAYADYHRK
nr:aldo/keto reductase [Maliibacterium massiliense]